MRNEYEIKRFARRMALGNGNNRTRVILITEIGPAAAHIKASHRKDQD